MVPILILIGAGIAGVVLVLGLPRRIDAARCHPKAEARHFGKMRAGPTAGCSKGRSLILPNLHSVGAAARPIIGPFRCLRAAAAKAAAAGEIPVTITGREKS